VKFIFMLHVFLYACHVEHVACSVWKALVRIQRAQLGQARECCSGCSNRKQLFISLGFHSMHYVPLAFGISSCHMLKLFQCSLFLNMVTEMYAETLGQLLQMMQPTSKAEAIYRKFV
jgi:hypothetical protein